MPRRYVLALVKHETNTFSPIPTPLSSFGHGEGPAFGREVVERFRGTNTPLAAYLDLAAREHAEVATPVAAESWPSNKASRATFEALVRPIEDAVRAGCDAVFLDLHGAMVIEDCDDPEGEIARRVRRIAPGIPIAVTLDYHTNLSGELVDNATVVTGYKTYPHVDMYEAGMRAGAILVRALDGTIDPVMAWGWKPLLASIMRHAPEDGPSGDILDYARAEERDGRVLAATLLPSFPHADTPHTGVSAIVVGDARRGGREALAKRAAQHRDPVCARDQAPGSGRFESRNGASPRARCRLPVVSLPGVNALARAASIGRTSKASPTARHGFPAAIAAASSRLPATMNQ